MEKNLSSLIEIIEQESEVLEILSDLLYRQKSAAIDGDIEMLNKITDAQGRAYAKIAELEQDRKDLIQPIADSLDVEPEEITLTFLKDKLRSENGAQWDRLYKLLKPLTERVKRAAKMNKIILTRCLEHGEQRLKLLLDFRHRQELYSGKGKKSQVGEDTGAVFNKKL